MKAIKVTQSEWLKEATRYIQGGLHRSAYLIVDTPVVGVFRRTQVDEDTCKTLGYEVVETYNNASTVVHSRGDFLFGHFCPIENGWRERFIEYFVEWLKSKSLSAEYNGNDILVDGYKVCGTCITRYGRIDYTAGFIGINTNIDHIRAICKKPMVKIPKGLADYGITTEDVEKMFIEFCETEEI